MKNDIIKRFNISRHRAKLKLCALSSYFHPSNHISETILIAARGCLSEERLTIRCEGDTREAANHKLHAELLIAIEGFRLAGWLDADMTELQRCIRVSAPPTTTNGE
jgi:hypothetical protein